LRGDIWPNVSEFGVQLEINFLACGDFIFRIDRASWAFWFAQGAVDTLIRVNNEEVRAFIKTVYRAYFYTVRVFALDAVVSNDKGHGVFSLVCVPRRLARPI